MRSRPDLDRLRDDLAVIEAAAAAMRIGEFDLFRRAFRAWFGVEPDEKRLEAIFVAYLFHREVPSWVRHFCRRALDERLADAPAPPPTTVEPVEPRRLAALAVVGAATLLFVAALTGNANPSCAGGGGDVVETPRGVVFDDSSTDSVLRDLERIIAVDAGLPVC